ncbi:MULTISPECIES: hypothetical protein [unclassified Rhodococcus (in: high G+C Gram-positive bacteria)]|uniref:hypothetical protein n=1 Tax=unclassified Rhodococcus (in: high G+C Gram-positive bacteria) TaxID=192944 RepID=UPI000E0C1725|nr:MULTISPECIES: hypothetical protein [unclassified Rhodococcus (in: high G+C Gram-positive bacteria)]QKT09445.1 hypothetical protein HUN07_00675 [Rhodococcus sp. W8901]RDI16429.1 hypothetical protein DEU38_12621 [Rhodococcus sp. AG1013]
MRKVTLLAAGLAAAAGLLVPATAANAADSADTTVTFAIAGAGGNLSLITGGPVGTIVPGAGKATGTLPTVTVSDNRNGAPRGWVASATSTDFGTIPKSAVVYKATALAGKVGPGTLESTGDQALDAAKTVVNRTGLTWPLEVITWTPALTVNYPDGAAIGEYSGTITVSVA